MFLRHKKPVLSQEYCSTLHFLRVALEVLTGQYVRIIDFDFNTMHTHVEIGSSGFDVAVCPTLNGEMMHFEFANPERKWYVAHWEQDQIRVICESLSRTRGNFLMWLVGRSATERHEEPVFSEVFNYAAEKAGMTPEEFLNSLPAEN